MEIHRCPVAASPVLLSSLLLAVGLSCGAQTLTFQSLDYPGASFTSANDINSSGVIVGHYFFSPLTNNTHGFVYDGNSYTPVDVPGTARNHAFGINDAGTIVGRFSVGTFDLEQGFIFDGNTYTPFNYPNAVATAAWDINNSGDIVGYFLDGPPGNRKTHGFYYQASLNQFMPLDYPGAKNTFAYHLNDFGVIVGTYQDDNSVAHGFIYDGGYRTLDYPGAGITNADGVNNFDVIVGRYRDQDNNWHGFFYDDESGEFFSVDADFPNTTYTQVLGVDDVGSIVGRYVGNFGISHGFLATAPTTAAVPELRGLEQNAAVTAIVQAGLVTGRFLRREYDPFVPAGEVITQWPAPDEVVEPGSVVEITVSRGPHPDAAQAIVNVNGQRLRPGDAEGNGVPFGTSLPVVIDYGMPIANVRVTIDDGVTFEATPVNQHLLRWWFNESGLQVGEHDITIEAFDGNGGVISTFESTFLVQEVEADVRLNGQLLTEGPHGWKSIPFGDPLPLVIDYAEQVANVRVTVDDHPVVIEATSPDQSLRHWWTPLGGLAPGEHEFLIEAFDEMGNKLSTFESPFRVLDIASTVRIGGREIAPGVSGGVGKGLPFGPLIPVVVDYARAVSNVRVTINGEVTEELTPYTTDLTNWWINLQELPPGGHDVKIEAFDESQTSVSTFETRVLVEEVASEVRVNGERLTSGQDGKKYVRFDAASTQVIIEYEQPVEAVEVTIDDHGIPAQASPVVPGDFTKWIVDTSGLGVGRHELLIQATSDSGTVASSFESPFFLQQIDSVVTVNGVRISSGTNGFKGVPFDAEIPILVNYGQDVANVRVSLDGRMPFEVSPVDRDLQRWFTNENGLGVGEHRLVIEALDEDGNKVAVFDSPFFIQPVGSTVSIGGRRIPSGSAGNKGLESAGVYPIIADYDEAVANVRIRLDGHPAFDIAPTDQGLQRFAFNWSDPGAGAHRVELEAFDADGMKVSAYQTDLWIFESFEVTPLPGGALRLTWEGDEILQIYRSPPGDYVDLPGATSPFPVVVDPQKVSEIFRLRAP